MKIAFILPDVDSFHALRIHFGLAYLSSALKAAGYRDIRFFAVTSVPDYDRFLSELKAYGPDIAAFTSVETQFENVIALSARIKEALPCVVVCGGTFATLFPDCVKDAPGLDGIFRGECEDAFLKFVRLVEQKADFRGTENFVWHDRTNDRLVANPLLPPVAELDRYGFADKDLFGYQSVIDSYEGYAPFMFNRGCPYDCAFCSNHALAAVYGRRDNRTRRRSVESCIAEIKDAAARFRFQAIHIWDDLFTSDRGWLYSFLERYREAVPRPFMCTTRSNICDDELFRRLKEAGCYKVHMSLESGNDFIRNRVMRRGISREKVVSSFTAARRHGIRVSASSIIGLPFETEEMIQETIALLASLDIDALGVNIFYPYRGTHLREVCERYGMIQPGVQYGLRERRDSVLRSPHISGERLNYFRDNFALLVRRRQGLAPYGAALLRQNLPPGLKRLLRSGYERLRGAAAAQRHDPLRRRLGGVKDRLRDLWTRAALRDPESRWLFTNRFLRMDANTGINDVRRRDFHKDRYGFAARVIRERKPAGAAVLDAACGTGYGSDILSKTAAADVTGVDIAPDAVAYAREHYGSGLCRFQATDVCELAGFPEGSFDAAVSFETIEHVDRPQRFLERLHAVLKPGGVVVLSTPNKWGITRDHKVDYDYALLLDHLGRFFIVEEVYSQNSGSLDLWVNRDQPRRIVKAEGADRDTAECFIAVCRKAGT